jgi:hypothetical protein
MRATTVRIPDLTITLTAVEAAYITRVLFTAERDPNGLNGFSDSRMLKLLNKLAGTDA